MPEAVRRLGPGSERIIFAPNGRYLASIFGESVTVFDAESGEFLQGLTGHVGSVKWALFNPEGTRLFSASTGGFDTGAAGKLHVWDLSTGRELLTLPLDSETAALNDSKLLLTGSGTQTRLLGGSPLAEAKQS